jgi:hypothetical protein
MVGDGHEGARPLAVDVLRAFESLSSDDLTRLALPRSDDDIRAARGEAEKEARRSGREADLAAVRAEAVDLVLERFGATQYDPTFLGLNWGRSQGPTDQRVAVAEAVADAASAALLGDVLDRDSAEVLRWRYELLVGAHRATPDSGSSAAALTSTNPFVRWLAGALVAWLAAMTVVGLLVVLRPGDMRLLLVVAAIVFVGTLLAIRWAWRR